MTEKCDNCIHSAWLRGFGIRCDWNFRCLDAPNIISHFEAREDFGGMQYIPYSRGEYREGLSGGTHNGNR